jgi:hypothetical protein
MFHGTMMNNHSVLKAAVLPVKTVQFTGAIAVALNSFSHPMGDSHPGGNDPAFLPNQYINVRVDHAEEGGFRAPMKPVPCPAASGGGYARAYPDMFTA